MPSILDRRFGEAGQETSYETPSLTGLTNLGGVMPSNATVQVAMRCRRDAGEET